MSDSVDANDGSPARLARERGNTATFARERRETVPFHHSSMSEGILNMQNIEQGDLHVRASPRVNYSMIAGSNSRGALPPRGRLEVIGGGNVPLATDSTSLPVSSELRRTRSLPAVRPPLSNSTRSIYNMEDLAFNSPEFCRQRRDSQNRGQGRLMSFWKAEYFAGIVHKDSGKVVGSRCELCQKCIFDEQRSATRLARHIYKHCAESDSALRNRIYKSNATIRAEANTAANLATLSFDNASVLTAGCHPGTSGQQFTFPLSTSGSIGSSQDPGTGLKKARISAVDINDCGPEDASGVNRPLLEAFVEMVWPFTPFDKVESMESKLVQALRILRPGYVRNYLPTRASMTGEHLDALSESLETSVQQILTQTLSQGYATLVFDGWEDATSRDVVNVLLRTEGPTSNFRKTFFLDSMFTGDQRMNSEAYASLIEEVVQRYGGMQRVCAITSDSTQCCVNAKASLMNAYPKVVSIPDQSHINVGLIWDALQYCRSGHERFCKVGLDTRCT